MRRSILSVLALVVVFSALSGLPTSASQTANFCGDAEERAFLTLINNYRASKGLAKLAMTQTLSAASDHHSIQMANKNYFSHDLLGGVSWSQNMTNHGYSYNTSRGENIAAGNATAQSTFTQWKNSSGHNANMLNTNFKAIGIGRAYNAASTYDWYWTTDFGGVIDAKARSC